MIATVPAQIDDLLYVQHDHHHVSHALCAIHSSGMGRTGILACDLHIRHGSCQLIRLGNDERGQGSCCLCACRWRLVSEFSWS